jgi:hypothetical protein
MQSPVCFSAVLMSIAALNTSEQVIVRRVMQATFSHFDVDFHTRLGVSTTAMQALLDAWPDIDDSSDESDACLAINNALNDLLHGVGIDEQEAMKIAGVSVTEITLIYRKWAVARGWKSTDLR